MLRQVGGDGKGEIMMNRIWLGEARRSMLENMSDKSWYTKKGKV